MKWHIFKVKLNVLIINIKLPVSIEDVSTALIPYYFNIVGFCAPYTFPKNNAPS